MEMNDDGNYTRVNSWMDGLLVSCRLCFPWFPRISRVAGSRPRGRFSFDRGGNRKFRSSGDEGSQFLGAKVCWNNWGDARPATFI